MSGIGIKFSFKKVQLYVNGCTALELVSSADLCHDSTNLKKFYNEIKNKDCFFYIFAQEE